MDLTCPQHCQGPQQQQPDRWSPRRHHRHNSTINTTELIQKYHRTANVLTSPSTENLTALLQLLPDLEHQRHVSPHVDVICWSPVVYIYIIIPTYSVPVHVPACSHHIKEIDRYITNLVAAGLLVGHGLQFSPLVRLTYLNMYLWIHTIALLWWRCNAL